MRPDLTQPLPINAIAPTIAGNANAKVMVWRGLYDPVWMMENADNGAASTSARNSYSYLLFSSAWSAVISALPFQVSLQISKMCTSMCHVTLLQGRLLVVGAGEFLPYSIPNQHSGNCVPICCFRFCLDGSCCCCCWTPRHCLVIAAGWGQPGRLENGQVAEVDEVFERGHATQVTRVCISCMACGL